MNITENNIWSPAINRIETSDALLGGADDSPLNLAVSQLAARTNYLKTGLAGFSNIVPITANHTLTAAEVLLSLVVVNAAAATLSIVLPALNDADLNPGARIAIAAINVNKSQVKISTAATDKIVDGVALKTNVYLGDGDTVQFILTATGWLFYDYKGNFEDVGAVSYGYKSVPNTIVAQGQVLNRLDYPRLWEFAQSLGSSLISDISWVGTNKGFYSTGNNTTTFRVPDLRGMFFRSLDLGAGVDFGRPSNNPGDYESDDLKSHDHNFTNPLRNNAGTVIFTAGSGGGNMGFDSKTQPSGGLETRPKNIGLLPLIKV